MMIEIIKEFFAKPTLSKKILIFILSQIVVFFVLWIIVILGEMIIAPQHFNISASAKQGELMVVRGQLLELNTELLKYLKYLEIANCDADLNLRQKEKTYKNQERFPIFTPEKTTIALKIMGDKKQVDYRRKLTIISSVRQMLSFEATKSMPIQLTIFSSDKSIPFAVIDNIKTTELIVKTRNSESRITLGIELPKDTNKYIFESPFIVKNGDINLSETELDNWYFGYTQLPPSAQFSGLFLDLNLKKVINSYVRIGINNEKKLDFKISGKIRRIKYGDNEYKQTIWDYLISKQIIINFIMLCFSFSLTIFNLLLVAKVIRDNK